LFYNLSFDEARYICRKQIEGFELWARRLIHEQLSKEFGANYINAKKNSDEYILKKELREKTESMMKDQPTRYTRPVDAFLLDDIIYVLCKKEIFDRFFKGALSISFPLGSEQVRYYMTKLINSRNSLSHANPISLRDVEKIVCYSNDFIDSLKEFYRGEGMDQEYNVPQIIKVKDSTGLEVYRENFTEGVNSVFLNLSNDPKHIYRPGDKYKIEVEIDPTLGSDSYNIKWDTSNTIEGIEEYKNRNYFTIELNDEHVATSFIIYCKIISNNKWHKYGSYDDHFFIFLKVLPSINH
jgi:hypothetical protein